MNESSTNFLKCQFTDMKPLTVLQTIIVMVFTSDSSKVYYPIMKDVVYSLQKYIISCENYDIYNYSDIAGEVKEKLMYHGIRISGKFEAISLTPNYLNDNGNFLCDEYFIQFLYEICVRTDSLNGTYSDYLIDFMDKCAELVRKNIITFRYGFILETQSNIVFKPGRKY